MALSRRTGTRFQGSIWPGFVDAMTGLLLVLMFVLTIFMVVQFVLQETITGQATELDELSSEVAALAQALGLEQDRSSTLTERVGQLSATLGDARAAQDQQAALIAALEIRRDEQDQALEAAQIRTVRFEEQVAGLLSQREGNLSQISELESTQEALLSEQESLQLALAGLRDEIDAQVEAARLDAARSDALEALIADLERRNAEGEAAQLALQSELGEAQAQLSREEQQRLVEAAAAAALRERLETSQAELTSMTLALEEQRREAEETLTLLAAAETAGDDLDIQLAAALLAEEERKAELDAAQNSLDAEIARNEILQEGVLAAEDVRAQLTAALAAKLTAEQDASNELSRAEERAILLQQAQKQLVEQEELASEAQKQQALLNQQIAAMRQQLSGLQAILEDAKQREAESDIQLQSLGKDLNTALARAAAEERRRRKLEEDERKRLELEKQNLEAEKQTLESEKQDLEKYRSEFFGRLRDVLGAQEGVQIVGDRFVFSSEILFGLGQASLSAEGQGEITKVAGILLKIANDIPAEIDWVLQVDGHTDDVPIIGSAQFANNWELSQARALSVVLYMINSLGIAPERVSANGFGQYQPLNRADTPEARAQNRRIELKFTGK